MESAKSEEKKQPSSSGSFSFCEVCKINHDQGRRHKYSSSHLRALSSLLSRFHKKLSDLRFFLLNPSLLRPEHSHRNRLWCPFCALDLQEIGSSFACSTAIYHLASAEHMKNVRDFIWKHGGGMDRVESFGFSEADLLKWEKGCESLTSAARSSGEGSIGPSIGPSKDIQTELTTNNMDNYAETYMQSFSLNVSDSVMPLQSPTNEEHWVTHSEFSGTSTAGWVPFCSPFRTGIQEYKDLQNTHVSQSNSEHFNDKCCRSASCHDNRKVLTRLSLSNGMDQRSDSGRDYNGVVKNLTSISLPSDGLRANVHTGAPPPWLEANEENVRSLSKNISHLSSAQKGKSRKLNPKRVGAAWAEKRRAEIEMEKRGEIVTKNCDANWLPNFGRVWQSGTRKESRKEFEKEKNELHENSNCPELSFQMQPYISKRMRLGSDKHDELQDHVESKTYSSEENFTISEKSIT
ncbi:TITAN-like protein [Typha latifolia]|uniref:TITAN-like protein n=1 Tax=Typha latifolia TaxID=4733 RepID=UPI003C2DE4C5